MKGRLLDPKGNALRTWPSDSPVAGQSQARGRSGDLVTIQEVLQAGAINLDAISQASGDPLRYDGINVVIYAEYAVEDASKGELRYDYTVRIVTDSEYKVEEPMDGYQEQRVVLNRHAIRIVVIQLGIIGVFDFQKLLVSVVAGMTLVAVATTIVDILALKFATLKDVYNGYKYEITEDFSEMRRQRSEKKLAEQEMAAHDKKAEQEEAPSTTEHQKKKGSSPSSKGSPEHKKSASDGFGGELVLDDHGHYSTDSTVSDLHV